MMKRDGSTFFGWPRVRAQAKYSAPLDSGDVVKIELWITEIKDKAIEWVFRLHNEETGVMVSKGSFATVHVPHRRVDPRHEVGPDTSGIKGETGAVCGGVELRELC